MQALDVAAGQVVGPAEQIGEVGDLGNATGCHLHFEVHLKNGSIRGIFLLPPGAADLAASRK
jgi:murein DD-endopeptidase MepM/ murein hydrolase activator NlpD